MFIDGKKYDSSTTSCTDQIRVLNPATGELVGTACLATSEDVDFALDSCHAAFKQWSEKSFLQRSAVLSQISSWLKEKPLREDLAILLTKEQGKPLREARREIEGVTEVIDYFVGLASMTHTDFFTSKSNGSYSFTVKKPLGVCASILPWNMPALVLAWKAVPALLTGNACFVKPSGICPLTVLELAAIFHEAGLPAGVLNVVTGSGSAIGNQLAQSPFVKKISFTGSSEAGKKLHIAAAQNNKRVTLELGGSDAMIICDDADIQECAKQAVHARFFNCGQTCVSPKRIFVFESVFDDFVKAVLEAVSQLKIGNGLSEDTTTGPLSSFEEQKKMIEYVESVRKEKASSVLIGGNVPPNSDPKGSFFEPAVLIQVPMTSRVMTEEVFGPIMVINSVKDMDEALKYSNETQFGLGASVWTNDLRQAKKAIEGFDVGIVWVNQHMKMLPELPFGGVKESGFGRENGYQMLNEYMETKTVVFIF